MNKKKNAKIFGVLSIVIALLGIAHKGFIGARAGWEVTLPIVAGGVLLALVSLALQRLKIGWVALVVSLLGVLLFLVY